MGQSAVLFVEEPPKFEIKDGLVHITQEAGDTVLRRVMLISAFRKAIRRARQTIAEFDANGSAEVLEFPKQIPAEHS